MRLKDFLENTRRTELDDSPIAIVKHSGLDIMFEGGGYRINGTNIVVVEGALISPISEEGCDFDVDASLTAILDCTDNTPDILYWETESYIPVVLYNYLTYLGASVSCEDIEDIDVSIAANIFENSTFSDVFAA